MNEKHNKRDDLAREAKRRNCLYFVDPWDENEEPTFYGVHPVYSCEKRPSGTICRVVLSGIDDIITHAIDNG